jgi:hypothetical protein
LGQIFLGRAVHVTGPHRPRRINLGRTAADEFAQAPVSRGARAAVGTAVAPGWIALAWVALA